MEMTTDAYQAPRQMKCVKANQFGELFPHQSLFLRQFASLLSKETDETLKNLEVNLKRNGNINGSILGWGPV